MIASSRPLRYVHDTAVTAFPGYPCGVVAQGMLFLSGLRSPVDGKAISTFADLPEATRLGRQGFSLIEEEEEHVAIDAWAAHDAMDRVLAAVGSTQEHVLRMRIWQRDKRFYPAYERVRLIRQPSPSASSGHSASLLLGLGARTIGLDGVAIASDETRASRDAIGQTNTAERPLTYYSLAARHGDYAFMAGHIPVKQDPGFPTVQGFDDVPPEGRGFATGRSHTDSRDGPIAAQAWYVYDQLRQNLAKVGAQLRNVAHCLVGLRDIRDVSMFHRVHRSVFGDSGPALTIVGAGEVGHRNSRIVVEATLYLGSGPFNGENWPDVAPLAAPMARRAGSLIFLSGMLGIDREAQVLETSDRLPPEARLLVRAAVAAGNEAVAVQCWRAWQNLADALNRTGSSLEHLVKLTVFVADPAAWPVFEAVRGAFLSQALPAIEAIVVPNPGPNVRCLVQIDAVASVA